MRHTAYNDYAAESRVRMFDKFGLSLNEFRKLNIGPILFKENTNFLKEISLGEDIKVSVFLKASSANAERFKLLHHIHRGDGKLSAEIEVFAAWIDLEKRKLTTPPEMLLDVFDQIPKTEDYEMISLNKN